MSKLHIEFMQRALKLASKGQGFVSPNPMVGAVVVNNYNVIGEGYHTCYGKPHAELEALANTTKSSIAGATIYINLEPCSHYGKTPPCAKALIDAGISKVVISCLDPNPLVSGRGVSMLEEAGIEVVTGVLESEAKELNRVFFKYITQKKPYVLMKTAMTIDGKIATQFGDSRWVSGKISRGKVHELRHTLSAVMVGVNTVLLDNPQLNYRGDREKAKQPIKIIIDSRLRTPLDSRIWSNGKIIIATTNRATDELKVQYEEQGAKVIVAGKRCVDLSLLADKLGELGIDSILLEGGATLNASAISAGIVDEVWTFIAPKIAGGHSSPTSVGGEGVEKMKDAYQLENLTSEISGEDILLKGFIKR